MAEPQKFIYQVGEKKFVQRKLVLGQIKQLTQFLKGLDLRIPEGGDESGTAVAIFQAIGDRLAEAVSIVLVEEGQTIKERDMEKLQEYLDDNMDYEMALTVISDFFVCNPLGSVLKELQAKLTQAKASMPQQSGQKIQ